MRKISDQIAERLSRNIQTRENNSNPSATIWVTRAKTNLISEEFVEKQQVLEANITDVSIAACHPFANLGDSKIYIGYISDGVARIIYSETRSNISGHYWQPVDFEENANNISIVFNAKMARSLGDKVEFITEDDPWVFWTYGGGLFAKKIGGERVKLADSNCTDVTAVRAIWSLNGASDFGLIVFYILHGNIYYRQLVPNPNTNIYEWTDAEVVTFGPTDDNGAKIPWSKITAFRTWDYRIGLQAQATNGKIYELFTQFMAIGKLNAEHIELTDIKTEKADLIEINEIDTSSGSEHIDLGNINVTTPYGGLYSTNVPKIVSAINVDDGEGNWGRYIEVEFDIHLNAESVSRSSSYFTLTDSKQTVFSPMNATLKSDGKTVRLEFVNFNSVANGCVLGYIPKDTVNKIISIADVAVEECSINIELLYLEGSGDLYPPIPLNIWNSTNDGTEIAIKFSSKLVNETFEGNEEKFTVTIKEYDYFPGGTLSEVPKDVVGFRYDYCSSSESLDLSSGEFDSTKASSAGIRLEEEE